jgi:CheY-like chemotaxis protein
MGGEIGVESAPGWGSTFWFTIPFEKTAASESGPLPVGPVLDGLRVLVVDGNRTSRTILQEQLTSAGILVSGADQVRRALELLHEGVAAGTAYEVVIIDRQLPGVDGLALARTIRAEPTFAATRIVLLDTPEDRGGMPTRRKGPGLDALAEVALRDGGSDAGHLVVRTRARRPHRWTRSSTCRAGAPRSWLAERGTSPAGHGLDIDGHAGGHLAVCEAPAHTMNAARGALAPDPACSVWSPARGVGQLPMWLAVRARFGTGGARGELPVQHTGRLDASRRE